MKRFFAAMTSLLLLLAGQTCPSRADDLAGLRDDILRREMRIRWFQEFMSEHPAELGKAVSGEERVIRSDLSKLGRADLLLAPGGTIPTRRPPPKKGPSPASPCSVPALPRKIHSGEHCDWWIEKPQVYCAYEAHRPQVESFFDWPDKVMDFYLSRFGGKLGRLRFVLMPPGGGAAFGDGFGVAVDAFWNESDGVPGYWGYLLTAHEGANYYTGHSVCGGWPCDWWADGAVSPACHEANPNYHSPAPASMANLAMANLDFLESARAARVHYDSVRTDAWFVLFHDDYLKRYGMEALRAAFDRMRAQNLKLDRVGENPSPIRTNTVIAFLCLGAGEIAPAHAFKDEGIPGVDIGEVEKLFEKLKPDERRQELPAPRDVPSR